ncbi:MAG: aldo/keto reductase [Bacteroidota bacterium]
MEKIKIAPNGPSLSPVIAGVMKWGVWGADLDTAAMQRLIEESVDAGITSFDHADIYGHYTTEAAFGQAIQTLGSGFREKIELISKCGIRLTTRNRPDYRVKSYLSNKEHIIWSVENSLRELGTDHLDLLLIHRPDPLMQPEEVAEAFSLLKQSGKVFHFGVSNFTCSQFELLASVTELVTNQVECSPLHNDPIFDGTFDQLMQRQLRPMTWSPFGGGQYFSSETSAARRLREAIREINLKYGAPGEDVILLAWLLRHPVGILPVLGTSKITRLKSGIKALDVELDSQDWYIILEAARGHEVA